MKCFNFNILSQSILSGGITMRDVEEKRSTKHEPVVSRKTTMTYCPRCWRFVIRSEDTLTVLCINPVNRGC